MRHAISTFVSTSVSAALGWRRAVSTPSDFEETGGTLVNAWCFRTGTMPANMRYSAVMRGSQCCQCHLLNALGSLMCTEDETCSRCTVLCFPPSASRNRHTKRTRCTGQSFCRASFASFEINANWSEGVVSTLLPLYYSIHRLQRVALWEFCFRLKSLMRCHSFLGTRDVFAGYSKLYCLLMVNQLQRCYYIKLGEPCVFIR